MNSGRSYLITALPVLYFVDVGNIVILFGLVLDILKKIE